MVGSCPTRSSQTLIARRRAGDAVDAVEHGGLRSLDRLARVEDEVALGVGRGELEEAAADRGVEGVGLGLETVVDVAAARAPHLGRDVEDDGEVGQQTTDGPVLQRGDLVASELAAGALVGDGAVDVAVGDDDAARARAPA